MAPAVGLYGVQFSMSLVHCMHILTWGKALSRPFLPFSEEFGNVDKIGVRNRIGYNRANSLWNKIQTRNRQ